MVRTTRRRRGRAPVIRRRTPPELPSEVVEDIFSRLPSKTVGLLRCTLSKAWCARLSTSAFVKAHFRFHLSNPGDVSDSGNNNNIIFEKNHVAREYYRFGYFRAAGGRIKSVTSRLFHDLRKAYVEASFYGFVLVSFRSERKEHEKELFLFNPTTSDALKLPTFRSTRYSEPIFGFGYDMSSDDYKIVRLLNSKPKETVNVEVYSVRAKSWRNIGESNHVVPRLDHGGVYLNNCIHWLARDTTEDDLYIIIAFDLAKEEFYVVPSPKIFDVNKPDEGANDDGSDDSSDHSSNDEGFKEDSDQDSCDSSDSFEEDSEQGSDDSFDSFEEDSEQDSDENSDGFEEDSTLLFGDDVNIFRGCLAVIKSDDIHERITIWVMREYGDEESWERHVIRTDYGYFQFVCMSNKDEAIFRRNRRDGVEFLAYNMMTRDWNHVPGLKGVHEAYDDLDIGAVPFRECHLYPNFV